MKRAVFIPLLAVVVALAAIGLLADEGMWTFDNPPRKLIKEKYGFDITDQWLEHIRLSAVRVSGASASFVSPAGLLPTLIDLARRAEPIIRELHGWQEEKIRSIDASAGEKVARAAAAVTFYRIVVFG